MGGGLRWGRPHYDHGHKVSDYPKQAKLPNGSVNEVLDDAAKNARERDAKSQMQHRNDAETAINSDIEGHVDIEYGGSVSKATYVDGVSDLDCRVYLNHSSLASKSPDEIKKYIAKQLKNKDPRISSVKVGRMGVTVRYRDGTEMQFIPAIRTRYGYKLPNGNMWSKVVYENRFKRDFSRTNKKCGGRLYHLVTVLKKQNNQNPSSQQLSGHHIEALANKIFKPYPKSAPRTLEAMMDYYYRHAPRHVVHRTRDNTGQSLYVDKDKLGGPGSKNRQAVARCMGRARNILRQAQKTNDTTQLDKSINGKKK